MEFLSLGLSPGSRKSIKVIKEINNNNRISLSIKQKVNELNLLTKSFVSEELSQYDEATISLTKQDSASFNAIQEAFGELYFLLDCENFRFDKFSTVGLPKVMQIYQKFASYDSSAPGVSTQLNQVNGTAVELVNNYMVLLSTLNLSSSLIYKTLVLKNQQVYWESIHSSTYNKLIYFIQISPVRLFKFVRSILSKASDVLETKEFNDKAYATPSETPGTEEDNEVYGTWTLIKYYTTALYRVMGRSVNAMFVKEVPSVSFLNLSKSARSLTWYKNAFKFIVRFPIITANNDIKTKLKIINQEIENNTASIDALLKTNLNDKQSILNSLESILKLEGKDNEFAKVSGIIDSIIELDNKRYNETDKPSFVTRYWIVLAILLRYGPFELLNAYNNRLEIMDWINENGIQPIIGFFKNWVIKPMTELVNILKRDDEITITTKDSLKSDFSSLERMIVEFAQDNKLDTTPEIIKQDVANGDLSLIMTRYENEIRNPIRYTLSGSLLRLLLIQIQKGKVDGGVAVNGIDKVLKSQQLVFGFVSMSPSLFILYQLYKYITSPVPITVNGKQLNIVCLKSLNNIENLLVLLSQSDGKDQFEGELLIEIINLIVSSDLIIPKQLHEDWVRDLNELNNVDFDIATKLNLVHKIWNMYGPYFR